MRNVLPGRIAAALAAPGRRVRRGGRAALRRITAASVAPVGWHVAGGGHVTGQPRGRPPARRGCAGTVRRAGRAAPLRQPAGAAGLPAPGRPEDHPGALRGAGHRPVRPGSAPLLVNPGGPGGSGLDLAAGVAGGAESGGSGQVRHHRVRPAGGWRSSVPALHCDPAFFAGARPDYIPTSKAAEQVLIGRARAYAADCERKYGWLLPHLTTRDTARDIDSIRAALGLRQISYFAYSYGTYIGQVYATMFPSRVRRMVLDSTVDPTGVWYADNIGQDYAFQGRQDAFYSWVASADMTSSGSVATQAQVAGPSTRPAARAGRPPGQRSPPACGRPRRVDRHIPGRAATQRLLAGARRRAGGVPRRGSTTGLTAAYQEQGSQHENEFAVYNAMECSDVGLAAELGPVGRGHQEGVATAPFEAWDNAWFNAACAFWPVHGPAQPMKIGASGLPGILMLQGTLDAATPYAGAQRAHRALPSARMVVVTGGGNHGQSLASPPNACVNGYLNRYLATGALPDRPGLVNATCPALPPPSAR